MNAMTTFDEKVAMQLGMLMLQTMRQQVQIEDLRQQVKQAQADRIAAQADAAKRDASS